ncbi:MAG: molybdopterin molybdotransferase MoeA [Gammaproteobacteria bacterium]|nr:molybdopterin molybdotransferase MoeA [Gammaproteobacteria bacterium]
MADCFTAPNLMPFQQALNTLFEEVSPITETEEVAIESSDQRIIAEAVLSPLNVPAHDNSAMDGYALCDHALLSGDTGKSQFKLVGISMAGAPFHGRLNDGECVRIMTGAAVPEGTSTVIMQENVKQIENNIGASITLSQPAKANSNIRKAGEDIQQGQVVFEPGHQIKAADIGLLASLGKPTITAFRKLKVAVLSTGDELKLPGEALQQGDIFESNSQVISAMLQRAGFEVINLGIIPDDKQAIEDAFVKADLEADAVVSSGGVSVGEADHTKTVLQQLGDIAFWKVAIKPGKPFAFGKLTNSVFFGLPGNPVSAAVTLHQLAIPAMQVMSGATHKPPQLLTAITTDKIKKRPGRMDFQRGITSVTETGQLQVTPLSSQGSGILSSISKANCYIVLAQEDDSFSAGEAVQVQLFDGLIG